MNTSLPLYYANFTPGAIHLQKLINPAFVETLPEGGRFYFNLGKAMKYASYVPRQGEWSTPWASAVAPGYEMPAYDATYSRSWEEVTDMRARDIKKIIHSTGKPVAVFYSGGIDSTVCMAALIKNLTKEEMSYVHVAMSTDSIMENPVFYRTFIRDKIKIIDSLDNKYSDLVEKGYYCVTADLGDCLFGTELGTKMYAQFKSLASELPTSARVSVENLYYDVINKDVHYSHYKDLIILYFNNLLDKSRTLPLSNADKKFGELLYHKIEHNIKTSAVPVNSLHDFFWWVIFNPKFLHCALRGGFLYSLGENREHIYDKVINWYGSTDYQLWSMANNNNGEKIKGTSQSSYKWAARKYIYDFDGNEWYFRYKIKIASLPFIKMRNYRKYYKDFDTQFGMNTNYDILRVGDPEVDQYITSGLHNYKIDW